MCVEVIKPNTQPLQTPIELKQRGKKQLLLMFIVFIVVYIAFGGALEMIFFFSTLHEMLGLFH